MPSSNASSGNASSGSAVLGQLLLYAAFAAVIVLFSRWPVFHQLDADQALIKLSIVHHGQRLQACTPRTAGELAKLPANMRAPISCPRERAPLVVEVDVDDAPVLRQSAQPSGLSRDGSAALYYRLPTPAGDHRIAVRLRDRADNPGFDYLHEAMINLRPAQIVVIDFLSDRGEITVR